MYFLSQQKYNKTVQLQVTLIPRQPGKELSVLLMRNFNFYTYSKKDFLGCLIWKLKIDGYTFMQVHSLAVFILAPG